MAPARGSFIVPLEPHGKAPNQVPHLQRLIRRAPADPASSRNPMLHRLLMLA